MKESKESQSSQEKTPEKLPPCQVTFSTGVFTGLGSSTHFNEKGMLILCQKPAALNEKLKLVLQFPTLKNQIEVQGEVVWTNIYGPSDALSPRGMGVKFLGVEREVERLLADLAGQYDARTSIYSCYYT